MWFLLCPHRFLPSNNKIVVMIIIVVKTRSRPELGNRTDQRKATSLFLSPRAISLIINQKNPSDLPSLLSSLLSLSLVLVSDEFQQVSNLPHERRRDDVDPESIQSTHEERSVFNVASGRLLKTAETITNSDPSHPCCSFLDFQRRAGSGSLSCYRFEFP